MDRWLGFGVIVAIGAIGWFVVGSTARGKEHGGQEHGGTTLTQEEQPPVTHEHGGKEHGGQEHGGQAIETAAPSAEEIRGAIRDHVQQIEERDGLFAIEDPETGTTRQLRLLAVHERVGKTGAQYYSCTDMRDEASGQVLDLDFDVEPAEDGLRVVDVRIHKVDGQARYTYDEHDNRIPLSSSGG